MSIVLDTFNYNIIVTKNDEYLYIKLFNKISYQYFDKQLYLYNISTPYIKTLDELFKIFSIAFDTIKTNNLDILSPNISDLDNYVMIHIVEEQNIKIIINYNMIISFIIKYELDKCSNANDEHHIEISKRDKKIDELEELIKKQNIERNNEIMVMKQQIIVLENIVERLCDSNEQITVTLTNIHGNIGKFSIIKNVSFLILNRSRQYEFIKKLSNDKFNIINIESTELIFNI